MNRGKGIAPDSSIAVREFTKWTDDMDFRLLSAMLDEARQKSLKDRWREVHNLFSGLNGFAWDESTKRFSAEPEVWDDLLTPSAAKWRVNPIRYYDLMEELWGADRATWHMARTAGQARRNIGTPSYRVDLNDDVDNIPEEQPFDPGFDTAYRSPPHVDSYSPGDGTQSIPSAASTGTGGTSSSRGTKRKAAMVDVMDAQFDKLTTKLDAFTDYFGRGMASGSRPTRKRTSMDRKGKGTTTSDEALRLRLPPIEAVLNQTRFFSKREQMVTYGLRFHHRVVLAPKLMDFPYFASSGLYFHHHLEFQGLKHFVAISSSYFEDLIKVFYSNLRVSQAGYLYSEVNKTKIKMKPADWLIVAGLKYEGHKFSFTNMPEDIEYDRDTTLASMIRPEMQGRNHGRINQDHGQNAEDEDQPMPEEHVADIGPQPTLQYDSQMLSQIWSDIQGLQEGLNNLNINVNSSIHGLQEGLTTLTTDWPWWVPVVAVFGDATAAYGRPSPKVILLAVSDDAAGYLLRRVPEAIDPTPTTSEVKMKVFIMMSFERDGLCSDWM
ncbi:hypothetical protein Fmac_017859 [Flemingia macrophylla]|uniref:Myb/SANT-like domain-containing protein n=1 Tax=Flemingia macrophylla TaxID=520843 RepID=A0ABD1M399_9FABA